LNSRVAFAPRMALHWSGGSMPVCAIEPLMSQAESVGKILRLLVRRLETE